MYAKFFKRCVDIFGALIALLLLSPLMLVIALLIKIFDPGPIIFVQRRVGRDGEEFRFFKFRSMPVNTGDVSSDQLGQIKLTFIGRLIRRTNIDELPQLFNILRGDMSIVGPRPPISSQSELIEIRKKNGAISIRPGLTGWAQVNSFDGMSVNDKAKFDGEYSQKLNLWLDIKIVLMTVAYLFKKPPVY